FDAKGVVKNHAEPGHRCGNALIRGGLGPTAGFGVVDSDSVAFNQHPAQHILRLCIALLGGGAIERGRTLVVLLDAITLEIECRKIALPDGVAAFGREQQPPFGEFRVALATKTLAKTGADIALGARNARMAKRCPDRKRGPVIAS